MDGIGGPELLLILVIIVLSLVPLALSVWAIIDTVSYPDQVWAIAGKEKQTWLILNIVGLVACFILPLVYLLSVRPALRRVTGSG